MVLYETASETPARYHDMIDSLLHEGEHFVLGNIYGPRFLRKYGPLLIATNRQLIELRKPILGESTSSISLATISRVKFRQNAASGLGELEVEGSGFDESFKLPKGEGDEFANAVREQLAKKEPA